jgi:hypothetical protein
MTKRRKPLKKKSEETLEEKMMQDLKEIKNNFASQDPESIERALTLCAINGIDPRQYSLYFNPEESDLEPMHTDTSYNSTRALANLEKIAQFNEQTLKSFREKYKNPKSPVLLIQLMPSLPNKESEKNEQPFHLFPYTKSELHKLPKPTLTKIIAGALSSYSSDKMMSYLNPREFLAKMYGIVQLKTIQLPMLVAMLDKQYMAQISSQDIFYSVIRYLDAVAYEENQWTSITKPLKKDRFSTSRFDQVRRLQKISDVEQKRFIRSLIEKPLDTVENHNYMHGKDFDKRLGSDTKEGYVSYLYDLLFKKWSNKDTPNNYKPIERPSTLE